jgi:hypothetical protein
MMRKDGIGLACRMILDGFSDPREAGFGIDQDVNVIDHQNPSPQLV